MRHMNLREKTLLPWAVFAGILAGMTAFVAAAGRQADFHPEHFGLGRNTVVKFDVAEEFGRSGLSVVDGRGQDMANETFRRSEVEGREVALWIGASQLHAVNRFSPGQRVALEYAGEELSRRGSNISLVQSSAANAGYHDLLVMYQLFRQEGLHPDWLIIASVYDDLREEHVKFFLLKHLRDVPREDLDIGGEGEYHVQQDYVRFHREAQSEEAVVRSATSGTPQERLEEMLVSALEEWLPGYRYRSRLMARINILVRLLENSLTRHLRESYYRVPRVPDYLKSWNGAALESMVRLARHDGTRILIYKQPHRPSEGPFYHDRRAYDEYFRSLEELCRRTEGVYFLDLEDLVPQGYWGENNQGDPDVFHFTEEGHRLLGLAVAAELDSLEGRGGDALQ